MALNNPPTHYQVLKEHTPTGAQIVSSLSDQLCRTLGRPLPTYLVLVRCFGPALRCEKKVTRVRTLRQIAWSEAVLSRCVHHRTTSCHAG